MYSSRKVTMVSLFAAIFAMLAACGEEDRLALDDFPAAAQAAICQWAVACAHVPDDDTCRRTLDPRQLDTRRTEDAIAAARLAFDEQAAARCIESIRDAECLVIPFSDPSCREMTVGLVPIGTGCTSSFECEREGVCAEQACSGQCCQGVCEGAISVELPKLSEIGGACQSHFDCVPSAYCEINGRCTALPTNAGQRCLFGCGRGDLFCDIDTLSCKAYGGAGEPCSIEGVTAPPCDPAWSYCDETCQPLPGAGEPCDEVDRRCIPTTFCYIPRAQCEPLGAAGQPCLDDSECQIACDLGVCLEYASCGSDPATFVASKLGLPVGYQLIRAVTGGLVLAPANAMLEIRHAVPFRVRFAVFLFAAANVVGCAAGGDQMGPGNPGGKGDLLTPGDPADYFSGSYGEARARFRELAADAATLYANVDIGALPVPSATDKDLTIDYLYIPAQAEFEKLIILSSGVHGAEAFVGSAVHELMLREWLPEADLERTGVLFIHSLNPWGHRHRRRVTENNIDLNRNFDIDPALFRTVNDGYRDLDGFLNKQTPVSWSDVNLSIASVLWNALIHGQDALREATLVGQYEFPLGIYFGGQTFEPNKERVEELLLDILPHYRAVFVGDVHTGYGERGRLHLFGAPGLGSPEATAAVFDGFEIDTGENNEDFYETKGDFILYVEKLLTDDQLYVGTTLEYGTLNSQTTLGSIRSLQRMRLENQCFHHGHTSSSLREGVIERFNEMFYPTDAEWRASIMAHTQEMLPLFVTRFSALALER